MKKDITTRKDVEKLVTTFYSKVKVDPVIGFIFSEVVPVNWEKHLPIMVDFWENILFHKGGYYGNPLQSHQQLNKKIKLTKLHFDQWILLFTSTVDELFTGENAESIKHRSLNIAQVMQLKIDS